MNMIIVDTEIVLTGMAGNEITNFINESIEFIKTHHVDRCLLSFNSWYYVMDKRLVQPTSKEIIDSYFKFNNNCH